MVDERDVNEQDHPEETRPGKPRKNIVICLDGTGNQFGENLSNVVKLFRMLVRDPAEQIAYYDPGVGTMGDPSYKTALARKINKIAGLAFGRGLMKNLIEAYTYLMEHYEDGDQVFIFGFSRGAYTARALAAFIKECGLFERGAENLLPYAMGLFLKQAPPDGEEEREFFKVTSRFRSTYGRLLNREGDPKYPREPSKGSKYQLRIHFLGLFDTVKSYGWVKNPVVLRNEKKNDSVLNVRHALAIDERRAFFHQMHWKASNPKYHTCKEVWFPGVHSDVGGGYPESDSGLAKIALEWMVHEACLLGLKVDPYRYGKALQKKQNSRGEWEARTSDKVKDKVTGKDTDKDKYSRPDPAAAAHESLKGAWKAVQMLPKKLEPWEKSKDKGQGKGRRTIMSENERLKTEKEDLNPLRVHQSVLDRLDAGDVATITTPNPSQKYPRGPYRPPNLLSRGDLEDLRIEPTEPVEKVFPADRGGRGAPN